MTNKRRPNELTSHFLNSKGLTTSISTNQKIAGVELIGFVIGIEFQQFVSLDQVRSSKFKRTASS